MKPQSPLVAKAGTSSSSNLLRAFLADSKQLDWDRGAASCMSKHAYMGTHNSVEQTVVENIEQFHVDAVKHGEGFDGSIQVRRMALANAARTAQALRKTRQTREVMPPPTRRPPSLPQSTHARVSKRQIKPLPANDDEMLPVPITLQRSGSHITRMLRPQDSNYEAEAATKLCATYRGMQLRKGLSMQQAAAAKLGSAFRGKAARKTMKVLRENMTADTLRRQNISFWLKLKDTLREEHSLVNFVAPSETEEGLTPAQVVQIFWTILAFE